MLIGRKKLRYHIFIYQKTADDLQMEFVLITNAYLTLSVDSSIQFVSSMTAHTKAWVYSDVTTKEH